MAQDINITIEEAQPITINIEGGVGSGETNTISNVGTAGVGVYKQKTGVNFELKKINAGSNKVTITDDTGNSEIDINIAEANIVHQNLSGAGTNTHAQIDSHISSTSNPHSVTANQVLPSQTGNNGKYLKTDGSNTSWETVSGGGGSVDSVFGRTGVVVAQAGDYTKSDVGLGNVDNTSDANKPISSATQTALDNKVDENAAITGATKTKITYDAKGLVTSGADATTADVADSTNKRYVTDAQLTVIGNTSGTNTGDQNLSGYVQTTRQVNGHALSSDVTVTSTDVGLGNVTNNAQARDVTNIKVRNIGATLKMSDGSALTTGAYKIYAQAPYAGTITGWRLTADTSTTTTIDVWKANGAIPTNGNTITASAKPALSAGTVATSTTLTGWTTAVSAGDIFEIEIEANNNATAITFTLDIEVTNA
jgi:hypothetical protein